MAVLCIMTAEPELSQREVINYRKIAGMMRKVVCEKVILSDLRLVERDGVMREHANLMTHAHVLIATLFCS